MVWNFCQQASLQILERERRFCTGYDLDKLTSGASKEGLSLHSQTVQAISAEYCTRRRQFKKHKLRWRVSRGARRSLGWIPFKACAIRFRGGQLHYGKLALGLWDSYGFSQYELGAGSFSEDARGRWYANISVKIPELCGPVLPAPTHALGIDLGLRALTAFSDAALEPVPAQRLYRDLEPALALAQRAKNKDRVKSIHAKISNRRKDALHKLSTGLVKNYGVIVVGDVSSSKLVKTKLAKSVLDAGWSTFKAQLLYKSHRAAAVFKEVNESFSTQDCSACGASTGPKGLSGLKVQHWTCSCCGIAHDRNRNAAQNILVKGLLEIERENPTTGEARAVEAVVNETGNSVGRGTAPLVAGIPRL